MPSKVVPVTFLCAALALPALCAPPQTESATGEWEWQHRHLTSSGVLLFGGSNTTGSLNDTWIWNGHNWIRKFPETSPPPRSFAATAYDKARHEVVLFGGCQVKEPFHDTWVWNGRNWLQKFPKTSPPPRQAIQLASPPATGVLAYDASHHKVVSFDSSSMTCTWDGFTWTAQSPSQAPPARNAFALSSNVVREDCDYWHC